MKLKEESESGFNVSWHQDIKHLAVKRTGNAPTNRTSYIEFQAPCRST